MAAIFVHVKRAVNLRSADFMGKSDPYVRFDFATDLTTSVIDNNNNPQWDECFLVADDGRTPLHFTVFDSDAGVVVDGSDDFLGAFTLTTGCPDHDCESASCTAAVSVVSALWSRNSCLLSSMLASQAWQLAATYLAWPVSGTHTIISALFPTF